MTLYLEKTSGQATGIPHRGRPRDTHEAWVASSQHSGRAQCSCGEGVHVGHLCWWLFTSDFYVTHPPSPLASLGELPSWTRAVGDSRTRPQGKCCLFPVSANSHIYIFAKLEITIT